jgi:hypothetical protein
MFLNGREFRMIDVPRPLRGVPIRAASEPWKKIEFQMIVRVDQSGQQKIAG